MSTGVFQFGLEGGGIMYVGCCGVLLISYIMFQPDAELWLSAGTDVIRSWLGSPGSKQFLHRAS